MSGARTPLRTSWHAWLLALGLIAPVQMCFAQARTPLIAVLIHGTEAASSGRLEAFHEGLQALGYVDGRNVRIERYWTDNHAERLASKARDIMLTKPDIVVAAPVISVQALQRESGTIPIVMASGSGALQTGLVASLSRPGGNVTGLTNQGDELTGKHIEILREIAPRAKRVLVVSSGLGAAEAQTRSESRVAAKRFGLSLIEAYADSPEKVKRFADVCRREKCDSMVVLLDPQFVSLRADIVAVAREIRVPGVYPQLEYVEDGGLISYSADVRQMYRRAATYVDRILKGAKPGDLPIEQPTKFALAINLKTAKAQGIAIPSSLRLRVDRLVD